MEDWSDDGERWRNMVEQVAVDSTSGSVSLRLATATSVEGSRPAVSATAPSDAAALDEEEAAEDMTALLRLLDTARRRFGAPLLRVTSADELKFRIDAMLEKPGLAHLTRASADFLTAGVISDAAHARTTDDDRLVFGAMATTKIGKGLRLAASGAAAYRRLLSHHGVAGEERRAPIAVPPLYPLIVSTAVPPVVSQILLTSFRGTPAILALAYARSATRTLPQWLADALATFWFEGQRASLRLLASVAEARVSERIVPLKDRLDFEALDRQMIAYRRRSEASFQRAKAANFPLQRA